MVSRTQHPCDPADLGARRRIPGAVDAWVTILRDHGKLGLDTLLQPAIEAAEQGYMVAPRIAFDWNNQFEKLKKGTNTERYLLPHGKPAVAGDVIHQPELGQTLRTIAKNGRDAFYKGAIAEDMVETLRGIGGLHTLDDFAAHSTETTHRSAPCIRDTTSGSARRTTRASPCW